MVDVGSASSQPSRVDPVQQGLCFHSDSELRDPSATGGAHAPVKKREVKIHTPVMITKNDFNRPHRATRKKYTSNDLWHQNRYPSIKQGLSRNVVINLAIDQDCTQQLERFCRVEDMDTDEELLKWLDTEMARHFDVDRDHVAKVDFFESRLFKSLPLSEQGVMQEAHQER